MGDWDVMDLVIREAPPATVSRWVGMGVGVWVGWMRERKKEKWRV